MCVCMTARKSLCHGCSGCRDVKNISSATHGFTAELSIIKFLCKAMWNKCAFEFFSC